MQAMVDDSSHSRATRRAALVDTLSGVFRERGYEGATLAELSAATGLGKASLYHHFPGGKAEMCDALIRAAVAEAQSRAFSRLRGREPPVARLQQFLAGFTDYLEHAGGPCLLGVLAMGSARQSHGARIAAQFRDWQADLARLFEEAGQKPKRAGRSAAEVFNALYGAQMTAALLDEPQHVSRSLKRLARTLEKNLG